MHAYVVRPAPAACVRTVFGAQLPFWDRTLAFLDRQLRFLGPYAAVESVRSCQSAPFDPSARSSLLSVRSCQSTVRSTQSTVRSCQSSVRTTQSSVGCLSSERTIRILTVRCTKAALAIRGDVKLLVGSIPPCGSGLAECSRRCEIRVRRDENRVTTCVIFQTKAKPQC